MTIDGLTERLVKRADEELERKIKEAAEPLRKLITDGGSHSINVRGGYIPGEDNQKRTFMAEAHFALNSLKELAFNMNKETQREKALREFLGKVESLQGQIDELRGGIQ